MLATHRRTLTSVNNIIVLAMILAVAIYVAQAVPRTRTSPLWGYIDAKGIDSYGGHKER